jgi:uncharacterized protein with beta-barrel porin domain
MKTRRVLQSHVSLLTLVFVTVLAESSVSAFAACTSTSIPTAMGDPVTCTGARNPGYSAPVTNLSVNILSGASVTGSVLTTGPAGSNAAVYSNVQVLDSSTITNNGTIANSSQLQRANAAVSLFGSNTSLFNNASITGTNSVAANTRRVYGVLASAGATDFDGVAITNNKLGTIAVTQSGSGNAAGIYTGENIGDLTIDNFGSITASRVGNAGVTAAVAGIDSDDDTDTLVVNNHQFASITATGANTYAVGGRAQDYMIQNDGTITAGAGTKAAILIYGGADDGTGSATIDNSATGVINGNVSITDTSPFGATLATTTNGTRDSSVINEGQINGSFIYGAGTHTIDNSGAITGSITVNQFVGAGITGVGGASFTLTNEGTIGGNITITDRADSVNAITLTGTGFAGNIVAVNGTGSNALTLSGVTNLASVRNFSALDLTTSHVTVPGGVSLVDGSTLNTTVFGRGGTTAAPSTNVGTIFGTLTLQGTTTVTPTFAVIAHNGDTYLLASQYTGTAVAAGSTALVTNSVSQSATGALLLTTAVADARSTPGLSAAGGATLSNLLSYAGGNAALQNLGIAVQALGTSSDVRAAGEALRPEVNGAAIQVPLAIASLFQNQVDNRLDTLLYAQLPTSGRSADLGRSHVRVAAPQPENALWASGIEGGIAQNAFGGVTGYTAKLSGIVGGYDRLIMPGIRVGGAFGYVDSQTHDNQLLTNNTNIQTYQGLAYASLEQANWYARGSVAYGGLNYNTLRTVSFAGFGDVARGTHGGNLFTGRVEGGAPIVFNSAVVVPYGYFNYAKVDQNAYRETSGNGAALTYNSASNDSERAAIGAKTLIPIGGIPGLSYFADAAAAIDFELRAAYVHEFGNIGQTVTAGFVGAGSTFVASGPNPSRDMVDYGAGFNLATSSVIFSLTYNGVARTTYLEQVGLFKARYVF